MYFGVFYSGGNCSKETEDGDDEWNDLLADPDLVKSNFEYFSISNTFADDVSFLKRSQDLSTDFQTPELGDLIDKVQIE